MASNFGPSTPLLQHAIQLLMQGRSPSDLAPVSLPPISSPQIAAPIPAGGFAPPGGFAMPPGPAPEPAPVAPAPALDQGLIEQLTGPRPVAPTIQQPGVLDKIAAVLSGIALGPQYGLALKEQRERPQREFQAANEQFQARKIRATEFAEEKRQREQDRITRDAMVKADREFELYKQRSGITDALAIRQMDEAHEMAKIREQERIADERLLQQQKLKFGEDLGAQIKFYRANGVSNAMQARRLALNDFADVAGQLGYTVPALTQADNAQLAKVGATIDRLNRLSRGGAAVGGGSRLKAAEKAAADFEAAKQAVVGAIQRGDVRGERLLRRKMDSTFGRLRQFSDLIESGIGEGGFGYQKPRGQQPQASAPSPAQPQEPLNFNLNQPQGPSQQRQAAKAKLMAAGFGDAEAEQELNRLGIR